MSFAFRLDVKHTLIFSGLVHLFLMSPACKTFFEISSSPPVKMDMPEIEFDFFQAAPREEKHLFIPKTFQPSPPLSDNVPLPLQDTEASNPKSDSSPPKFEEEELNDAPTPSEDLPPSLEEQASIQKTEDKTSDSLDSEVELAKQEEDKKTAWDYCNRVRTLVENNIVYPANLKNQGIEDIVKVNISLSREGKLIPGSLKIAEGCASRYPEINTQALEGVYRAAEFFPPIPKRYSKDEINFSLPIRFDGSTPQQSAPTMPVSKPGDSRVS